MSPPSCVSGGVGSPTRVYQISSGGASGRVATTCTVSVSETCDSLSSASEGSVTLLTAHACAGAHRDASRRWQFLPPDADVMSGLGLRPGHTIASRHHANGTLAVVFQSPDSVDAKGNN